MKLEIFKKESEIIYPVTKYIKEAVDYIDNISPILIKDIKESNKLFVNIWVRGSSGAFLAGLLTPYLINGKIECNICHVKKSGEKSHSPYIDHFRIDKSYNVILDDFMQSGNTINSIFYKMKFYNCNIVDSLILDYIALKKSEWSLNFIPKLLITTEHRKSLEDLEYLKQLK